MSFRLANLKSGVTPVVKELPVYPADGSFAEQYGALLFVDNTNNFEVCAANPATVAAVALGSVGIKTPFSILGVSGFPPLRAQGVWVGDNTPFIAKYKGSLGTPGDSYGVIRDTDGLWKVDFTNTSELVVIFMRDLETDNLGPGLDEVLVTFINTVVQPMA